MQPLGYYGLNLDVSTEYAIDSLQLHELTDLLEDMTYNLNVKHYCENDQVPPVENDEKPVTPDDLSDREKIALIRGLCDRIELKLMEQAK